MNYSAEQMSGPSRADESHDTSSETSLSQRQSGTPRSKTVQATPKPKEKAAPRMPKTSAKQKRAVKATSTAKRKAAPRNPKNAENVATVDETAVEMLGQAEGLSRKLGAVKGKKRKADAEETGLVFDLGSVLAPLKERMQVDHKTWCTMLKARGISESTDWRSRKLFEAAGTRENLGDLGINQAYKQFGVHKDEKSRSLDKQLVSLAKQVAKVGGNVVDPNHCRSVIEQLKATLDALLTGADGANRDSPARQHPWKMRAAACR